MSPDDIMAWLRTHPEQDVPVIPPGPAAIAHIKRAETRVSVCTDVRCKVTIPHPVHPPETAR